MNGYNQSIGLGDYFLDSVQTDVRSLVVFAGAHLRVGDYYRMLCKRFPLAIYYMIENGRADIYAILDNRRDPDWIIGRLRSPGQLE